MGRLVVCLSVCVCLLKAKVCDSEKKTVEEVREEGVTDQRASYFMLNPRASRWRTTADWEFAEAQHNQLRILIAFLQCS